MYCNNSLKADCSFSRVLRILGRARGVCGCGFFFVKSKMREGRVRSVISLCGLSIFVANFLDCRSCLYCLCRYSVTVGVFHGGAGIMRDCGFGSCITAGYFVLGSLSNRASRLVRGCGVNGGFSFSSGSLGGILMSVLSG